MYQHLIITVTASQLTQYTGLAINIKLTKRTAFIGTFNNRQVRYEVIDDRMHPFFAMCDKTKSALVQRGEEVYLVCEYVSEKMKKAFDTFLISGNKKNEWIVCPVDCLVN